MAAGDKHDSELIERVVREVIRRLLERGVSVGESVPANGTAEVVVQERVVALATIEGRLKDVRRVVVGRRAVVTPAVRDELKDRGIELERR